jgi:hypothetical protein
MALQPFVGLWLLFQFRNLFYTDGRTPWTGDQPVPRPLPKHRTTQTQTSIPRVGFEPTIPVLERAKTVHALDRATTVIGFRGIHHLKFCMKLLFPTFDLHVQNVANLLDFIVLRKGTGDLHKPRSSSLCNKLMSHTSYTFSPSTDLINLI